MCWLLMLLLCVWYDAETIYVRCLQFLPESLGYNFQMRAPCPFFFTLFRYLGWFLNQSRYRRAAVGSPSRRQSLTQQTVIPTHVKTAPCLLDAVSDTLASKTDFRSTNPNWNLNISFSKGETTLTWASAWRIEVGTKGWEWRAGTEWGKTHAQRTNGHCSRRKGDAWHTTAV